MDERQLLEELRVAREQVDRTTELNALGNLGIGYYQQQNWQEAIDRLTEYLNVAIELGNQWAEAVAQYYLGFTLQGGLSNYILIFQIFIKQGFSC